MTETLLAVGGMTVVAYAVKAATGFGPALVVVSLGSVLVGPAHAVVLAAFLDLASGAGVLWLDRGPARPGGGPRLAATMAGGAIAGGVLLGTIPTETLTRIVAVGVLGFGLWLGLAALVGRRRPHGKRSPVVEHLVVALAGVSGGLIGIGGPPLVVYFGGRLDKAAFRALIVPILLAAAVTRVAVYGAMGQVDGEVLALVAVSLPALPVGLLLGDRIFRRFSERAFQVAIALLVTAAGARLLF